MSRSGIALYPCTPDAADELEFDKNDIIINITPAKEAGWSIGTRLKTNQTGLFPNCYVKFDDNEDSTPPLPPRMHVPPPLPIRRPETPSSQTKTALNQSRESLMDNVETFWLPIDQAMRSRYSDCFVKFSRGEKMQGPEVKNVYEKSRLDSLELAKIW
ncbi:hypothetical protein ROZALSC1DRAFT_20524 [Rozella allomycis CSF55]|uniref:SH3 domain-containing protein n=1 Tax=Rozella allomycis (strain CSF55) TaxID=988480 RepID=A0A4P9YQU0_ROZAC|nr:hypothetical protein ROZALSC1DRAFT_20524 [Rozella allomycis CSF55]